MRQELIEKTRYIRNEYGKEQVECPPITKKPLLLQNVIQRPGRDATMRTLLHLPTQVLKEEQRRFPQGIRHVDHQTRPLMTKTAYVPECPFDIFEMLDDIGEENEIEGFLQHIAECRNSAHMPLDVGVFFAGNGDHTLAYVNTDLSSR